MTKMMLMWGKKNERTISAPLRERERETAAVSDGTVFFLYVSVAQTVSEKKTLVSSELYHERRESCTLMGRVWPSCTIGS